MGNLPLVPQRLPQYQPVADNMWPGMPVREDVIRHRCLTATQANPIFTQEVWTAQFNFNATDEVGITFSGTIGAAATPYAGTFSVPSDTDDETTALAWIAAHGQTLVNIGILAVLPTSNGTGLVTLTMADGTDMVLTSFGPLTADVTLTQTVAADGPDLGLTWGMGVVVNPDRSDPNVDLVVRRPRTAAEVTDSFAGVIIYAPRDTDDARVARGFPSSVDIAPDMNFEVAIGQSMTGIFVHYAIDGLPAPTDASRGEDAFLVFDQTNPDWGKFRNDSGGTSEVQTITFTGAGAGTAAGNYDGLLDISFADQGTDAANAARFVQEWNARVDYAALGSIVDSGGGVVTITFADTMAHTFTDNSAGGPVLTDAVTTPPVAAIAALCGFKFLRGTVQQAEGTVTIARAALNMRSGVGAA